jgi:hypothetical protein
MAIFDQYENISRRKSIVVDRHRFDAGPDFTFLFYADSDPDPDPTPSFEHVGKSEFLK